MDAIVAVYSDWGIGAGGTQPVVLKADRQHFVELTRGRTVIVGRRTLADFPGGRPLRGRRNIVLTRGGTAIDGAELAHSAAEAYEMSGADAMVLGGQSVFRDMMPYIDRIFVTRINCRPCSDSFFENLDESSDWRITDQSEALREGDIEYSFICYERIER